MKASARCGAVLIIVLLVIAMLSLAAYTFSDWAVSERRATNASGIQLQARATAGSGVELVRSFLMLSRQEQRDAGGLYDNPGLFASRIVVDDPDPAFRGYVSVVSPTYDENAMPNAAWRFGLENESSRLNVNALPYIDLQGIADPRDQLLALPGMTIEIADAMLDWIDTDDKPREFGAEVEYYSSLSVPTVPANGEVTAIDELLAVRDVTPELLFGSDRNRNGIVESNEREARGETRSDMSGEYEMTDRGWSAYLTVYSQERNVNALGQSRVYLNMQDMRRLYDELSAALSENYARFIVAYRQFGSYRSDFDPGQVDNGVPLDFSKPGRFEIASIFDLVGIRVRIITGDEGNSETYIVDTAFPDDPAAMATYLPLLLDNVTLVNSRTLPARININQAPRPVLLAIPFMTETLAEAILATRREDPDDENGTRLHESWLLTRGLVERDEFELLLPYITTGGDVWRAQIVSQIGDRGPSLRHEVLIDASRAVPHVIMWRDLSHLGRGFSQKGLGGDAEIRTYPRASMSR